MSPARDDIYIWSVRSAPGPTKTISAPAPNSGQTLSGNQRFGAVGGKVMSCISRSHWALTSSIARPSFIAI